MSKLFFFVWRGAALKKAIILTVLLWQALIWHNISQRRAWLHYFSPLLFYLFCIFASPSWPPFSLNSPEKERNYWSQGGLAKGGFPEWNTQWSSLLCELITEEDLLHVTLQLDLINCAIQLVWVSDNNADDCGLLLIFQRGQLSNGSFF